MTASRLIFLTHAEVAIDPAVPVPDWGLSARGCERHEGFAASPELSRVTAIYASAERKAAEGAAIHAVSLGVDPVTVPALHENDRSATGYLPAAEFEATADRFFAEADSSIRGWETARAAQARIVAAVSTICALAPAGGDLLIVAHGAVGALLRCHLKRIDITRAEDQPPGGGCWFATGRDLGLPPSDWSRI